MGKGFDYTILQRRHKNYHQAYEKMLNITNHKKNVNENYKEISPVLSRIQATIKRTENNKSLQGCREFRTPVYCWWECRIMQPLQKTVCSFLKKIKLELPSDPAILLLDIYTKKLKAESQRDACISMFIAALSQQPRGGSNPNVYPWMN